METKKTSIDYTDVVIIGNGPSGITLSYMLSGNMPYYNGDTHPNEHLHQRLQKDPHQCIIDQDLDHLSSGLEGRSSNPMALLFDNLVHPDADLGLDTPSVIDWKMEPDREIKHVVLGKKSAGGAWQMIEVGMQTLSLAKWMELPSMPYSIWLEKQQTHCNSNENMRNKRGRTEDLRCYYKDYVHDMSLEKRFQEGSTVTSVERVLDVCHLVDGESGEQQPCGHTHEGKFKWEVRGYQTIDNGTTVDFCYRAPNIVLATGTFDNPNRLCVPGENLPNVLYSLDELEKQVQCGNVNSTSDPVVVVGAGLSSADAIIYAQTHNIPVIHIFRRDLDDSNIVFRHLPSLLYPEYHQVHDMMLNKDSSDSYQSFPSHTIAGFLDDNQVIIRHQGKKDTDVCHADTILKISFALVQIGSRPDLSFLPHRGQHLGVVPGTPIDSKHNPLDVQPFTYQSFKEAGLYAMGPLVGDNFVRFLQGGAMAITAHLQKNRNN